MYCLGFDPGVHTGWAVVRLERPSSRPSFVEGGVIENGEDGAADRLRASMNRFGTDLVVGVETIVGYTHARGNRGAKAMTKHINAASELAGNILGMAKMLGLRVEKTPASEWRRRIGLRVSSSDAAIKVALGVLVAGMPKVSSAHLRDAAGCALCSLWKTELKVLSVNGRRP